MIATLRADGSYSIGDAFGDFIDPDDIMPCERVVTMPKSWCSSYQNRTRHDASAYQARVKALLKNHHSSQIERRHGISHTVLDQIASGKTKHVQAKTAAKLDHVLKLYGM